MMKAPLMSISFQCPACGKGFSVGDEFAGKKAKCKQCGGVMVVPAASAPKKPAPAPPPPDDLYGFEETPLPPRSATAASATRPAAKGKEEPPRLVFGSPKKKKGSSSDSNKAKGFAGIGGSAFVVALVVIRLMSAGARIHRAANQPPAVAAEPSAFVSAPAQPSTQPWTMPTLPERGPMREFQPGVTFQEIRIGSGHPAPGLPPAHGMTLYFYLPPGDHAPGSLPCVLIAPAGSILVTGMDLAEGDQKEHVPYVRAGFAVLSYSLDGHVADLKSANDAQIRQASMQFLAAKAGLTNAQVALEWLTSKVPEVDAERIYTAGHSSAGTMALLLAENESRIKKCAAFAPRSDVESNFPASAKQSLRQAIPGVDAFFTTYNPKHHAGDIGCPVLLLHSLDDPVVPAAESQSFASTLKGLGKEVKLVTVPVGGHYEPMIRAGIPRAIAWFGGQASSPNAASAAGDANKPAANSDSPGGPNRKTPRVRPPGPRIRPRRPGAPQ